jgi:gallate dioxygenase
MQTARGDPAIPGRPYCASSPTTLRQSILRRPRERPTRPRAPATGPVSRNPVLKQSERDFANPQPGSYLLTVSLAQQAYRLSAFCRSLMQPENRAAFKADELRCLREAGLSEAEIGMVRARDWLAMVRYGVNHFLVFRLASCTGEGLAAAGARMRGESLEEFASTRRVWEGR